VDEVETAGETHSRSRWPGGYDAPEVVDGKISPATDVWSMGVVLVKALSQEMPVWNRWSGGEPEVPESLPEPFAGIARECLQVDPSQRCTLATIKTRLEPGAAARPAATPIAVAPVSARPVPTPTPAPAPVAAAGLAPVAAATEAPAPTAARATPGKRVAAPAAASGGEAARESRPKVPAAIADLTRATDALYRDPAFRGARKKTGLFAWATLLIAVLVFAVLEIHSHRTQAPTEAVTQNPAPAPAVPQAVQPAPEKPVRTGSAANGAVVQQVMPEIPPAALATIQGHVRVAIHVEVDTDGNVSNAAIETEGPSRYFANSALNAARGWKFRPAEKEGQATASTWTLHFAFASSGVEARPVETRP
jgi:TonB family protein